MDKTEFNRQWEELKKGKNFCRMQSASDVLSILSYKWSQVSADSELGKEVWEGINQASYEMTKAIMKHIPLQEQQHVFGIVANIMNYTFVISEHEKDRKEAKDHTRHIINSTIVAIAHAREGKARITKIKREVVREILDQVWEKNPSLNGNVRGTALAVLDKINTRIKARCEEGGIPEPKPIKLSAAMDRIREVISGKE